MQLFFVLSVQLMGVFRAELIVSQDLLVESCKIAPDDMTNMGLWFESLVALLVLLPIPLAIADTAGEILMPEVRGWRAACANDPTFPPSFYDYFWLGQMSSVPADKRLAPALPAESRKRLDAVHKLCLNDASKLWNALAGLEAASRNFAAVVHAPGKLAKLSSFSTQWVDHQHELRKSFSKFLEAQHELTLQLRNGDRAHMAAVQPRTSLGDPLDALEALYPEVVARRQADLARIAR